MDGKMLFIFAVIFAVIIFAVIILYDRHEKKSGKYEQRRQRTFEQRQEWQAEREKAALARTVVKTKIIDTVHMSVGLRNRAVNETIFMVYYADGSRKHVKVGNQTLEYKEYMKKLEV